MTPSADQVASFTANGGLRPGPSPPSCLVSSSPSCCCGRGAMRTAYVGWAEHHLTQRQFLGVIVRFCRDVPGAGLFLLS